MSRYIGYLVLLISLYASGVVSAECEEPECPVFDSIMLPYPNDCSKFIYCDNGVKKIETCPDGLHFNPIGFYCDWPGTSGCVLCDSGATDAPTTEAPATDAPTTEVPITDGPTTTEEPTTDGPTTTEEPTTDGPTTTDGSVTIAPETCEVAECPELPANQFLFLQVPWSCSKYVMCLNGNVFEMYCSSGLIFDEVAQNCVIPQDGFECNACEIDVTTVEPEITTEQPCKIDECSESQETPLYLSVPWDCNQLILCIRGQTFEQTCGKGLHFSPVEQTCVLPENTVCEVCEQIELTTESEVTTEVATEAPVAECKLAPCYNIMEYHSITAVPWNCSQFVECYMGQRTTYQCADGKYFDSVSRTCNVENVDNCVPCKQ